MIRPTRRSFRSTSNRIGWDNDWKDVGNRRQAFYTGLGPGSYQFRVAASNNDGVWNEAGASLDFSIAPAYYQTTWFRLAGVAVAFALIWALHHLRLTALAREFNMRVRLRQLESDFAHKNRLTIMGELTASLAHEITQRSPARATMPVRL